MPAPMPRPFRVPDDVYLPAIERARADGITLTSVVVMALREYVASPPSHPTCNCSGPGSVHEVGAVGCILHDLPPDDSTT